MNHVLIVNQMDHDLANLVVEKIKDCDVATDFSKLSVGDTLLWLPNAANVEAQVFNLIDVIDEQHMKLKKIVMIAVAGVNDEISKAQQEKLWGANFDNLILDYQYAIKMIDELEMPYTIVRIPVIVNEETMVVISNEGSQLNGSQIGQHQLVNVISETCLTDYYLNQSIGVSEG